MGVFAYKAVEARSAAPVAGTIVADTARQARDLLRERGLTITDVRATRRAAGGPGAWFAYRDRAAVSDFIRNLATLLGAGISLLSALQTLAEQHNRRFRAVVQDMADQIAAGSGLADAMKRHPACFDDLCVSIAAVGENTGSLDKALARLSEFLDKAGRLRGRITSALIYPAVVCVIGLSVGIFLMTYVIPNLMTTLQQAGKELPMMTRVVQGASTFLLGWWWALLGGAGLAVAGVAFMARIPAGRLALDRLILRIPVIGNLVRKEYTSRIAVVLAALLRSGVPFIEAVQITRRTIRNRVFARALEDYEAAVEAGRDIAGPLKASGVFSPTVVQMLAVGQESGQLEEMLQQLAEVYDREVSLATQRLTSLLEPLVIVLLAAFVGCVALATLLPILEASNVL
jgi:general secretion pathway protein F